MPGPVTSASLNATFFQVNEERVNQKSFSVKKIMNSMAGKLPLFPNFRSGGFDNGMPNSFPAEVDESNLKAISSDYLKGLGPYSQGTEGFHKLIESGKEFKWIVNSKGLSIISPALKHSVASGGGRIITAGTGKLSGDKKVWINNDTGHYKTNVQSLSSSISSWQESGYDVDIRERLDFAAAFKNL
ncbi:hypothetical protein KFE26_21215 [Shewanella sp. M16]|uniref:hypothetical protein n=1 Tax=Shewanella sp. M16 TaxID=2830837 RepID=UPI001BB03C4C|nr:hypothetical protein [Shewanella sp. M16]MBS0044790.1 hypothetical protein [Shewanella sp. M16]